MASMTPIANPRRRRCLQAIAALPLLPLARPLWAGGLLQRTVPASGESLPVIGLGTWRQLDLPAGSADLPGAVAALRRFLELGGRVVDTSPMYGHAEARLGEALKQIDSPAFIATKLWTDGLDAGRAQLQRSMQLIGRPLDLVFVHNLRDLHNQLRVLREAREAGSLRLIGVSHYTASAHQAIARVIEREKPDLIQVNYSLAEPEAARRLLPLAAEHGVAVLINRPFAEGALFRRLADRPLPTVASELQCSSWAQLLLKWILAEPAVTCVLAGTSRVRHVEDNLSAASQPMPDTAQRRAIEAAVA